VTGLILLVICNDKNFEDSKKADAEEGPLVIKNGVIRRQGNK